MLLSMPGDDIEKIQADERALQERKKAAIDALLKKREAQNKEIDDQLARLGYESDGAKSRRSHHGKKTAAAAKQAKPPEKSATEKPKA